MNIQLLLTFIGLSIVNVILQTVKSIATVKCGKWVAAIINAVTFFVYTIVTVYTMCDLPLFLKAGVVALTNLIGVFIVKAFEEKFRKDKLWKIECAIRNERVEDFVNIFSATKIPFTVLDTSGSRTIVNIYASTQKQSATVKNIADSFNVKYFITESKSL